MTGAHFSKHLLCVSPSLSPSRIWESYLFRDLCAQCRSSVQNSMHLLKQERRESTASQAHQHTHRRALIFLLQRSSRSALLVGWEPTSQETRQFTCSTNVFDQKHQCHLGGVKGQFTQLAETLLKSSYSHSVYILARTARSSQLMAMNLLARLK